MQCIMSNNGFCYTFILSSRACFYLGICHARISPYTIRTKGKAECFMQTALRKWAYATACQVPIKRRDRLLLWIIGYYNGHRLS